MRLQSRPRQPAPPFYSPLASRAALPVHVVIDDMPAMSRSHPDDAHVPVDVVQPTHLVIVVTSDTVVTHDAAPSDDGYACSGPSVHVVSACVLETWPSLSVSHRAVLVSSVLEDRVEFGCRDLAPPALTGL